MRAMLVGAQCVITLCPCGGADWRCETIRQYKPRDKITQKMTRDGLIEVNETKETTERVSNREKDTDFLKNPEQQAAQDAASLMALMDDGETTTETPAVCTCTEKCETGKINTSCPVCSTNMTACSGKEAEPETEEVTEQPEETSNTGGLFVFLIVALLGGGGALYYFKFMKPKQSVKGSTDLEDFDFEDYDEDEPEADDADDTGGEETEDGEA